MVTVAHLNSLWNRDRSALNNERSLFLFRKFSYPIFSKLKNTCLGYGTTVLCIATFLAVMILAHCCKPLILFPSSLLPEHRGIEESEHRSYFRLSSWIALNPCHVSTKKTTGIIKPVSEPV